MKKERIARLLKDYQGYLISIATSALILGIIKLLGIWLVDILNYPIKIWIILVLLIITICMVSLIRFLIKRTKSSCKFEIPSPVQHKGYNLNMTVVKYKQYKNQVLCSWMENNKHNEKWFNQDALEEYTPSIPLPFL